MRWDKSWNCAYWSFKTCRNSLRSLSWCSTNCGSNRSILNIPSSNTTFLTTRLTKSKRESFWKKISIWSFQMSALFVRKRWTSRSSAKLSCKKSCSQKWTTTKERRISRRPIWRLKRTWTHSWSKNSLWPSIANTTSSTQNASKIGLRSLQIVLFAKKASTLSKSNNLSRIRLFIKSEKVTRKNALI